MDLYDRSTLVQLDCAQKLTRGGSQKVGQRAMEPSCAVIEGALRMQVKEERQATNRRSESLSVSYCVRWHLAAPWCSRHWAPPFPFDNLCSICSSFSSAGKSCNCERCTYLTIH